MKELRKEDIKILDFILNEIIFKKSTNVSDLIELKLVSTDIKIDLKRRVSKSPEKEFKRLAYILQKYNVCNILETKDGILLSSNNYSQSFQNNGGFEKLFNKQQFLNEKKDIKFDKLQTDLKLNKWLLKTKYLTLITILSFSFTVFVYFDSKKESKTLQQRIQNLELIILEMKK